MSAMAMPMAMPMPVATPAAERSTTADSTEVASLVTRFHSALATGDSLAALALLAPDAQILESGSVETVDDYRAHHLSADIAFAKAVPSTRTPPRVTVRGDLAFSASTSVTTGTYRERVVDTAGAELLVARRTAQGWRIAAIHWSSRKRN
jgi:ketosteroid isomerase-like protein